MGYLKYKGYLGTIEYDEDEQILTGKVLGLRKAGICYEGNSVQELREDFRNGIDHYLAVCKEQGISPEKGPSGRILLRISPELHRSAVICATDKGISLNEFINRAIQSVL